MQQNMDKFPAACTNANNFGFTDSTKKIEDIYKARSRQTLYNRA